MSITEFCSQFHFKKINPVTVMGVTRVVAYFTPPFEIKYQRPGNCLGGQFGNDLLLYTVDGNHRPYVQIPFLSRQGWCRHPGSLGHFETIEMWKEFQQYLQSLKEQLQTNLDDSQSLFAI